MSRFLWSRTAAETQTTQTHLKTLIRARLTLTTSALLKTF